MFHDKTTSAAKGKWRGILMALGVPETALHDRHGPCPLCGGNDRFRWDNQDGQGTYICGQCGAGNGMKLAIEFTGQPFRDVASRIDQLLGNIKPDTGPQRRELSEGDRRDMLRNAYASTAAVQPGDLVDAYMASRGLDQPSYPAALRFSTAMKDGEGGVRPCMVALVGVHGETDDRGRQRYCSLHRTFLRPDGRGKAEMASPRKMMPGQLPDGACVMLSDWPGYGAIGVAEGIETALAASARFEIPVWAAISSNMLAKWNPPVGAEEVAIFGDNDPKFGGQAAAYSLAHRLAVKGLNVSVHIPQLPGTDWADQHRKSECTA